MTLTDSGPLVALVDVNQAKHGACVGVLPRLSRPLVTTWPCYTEAMYLLYREGGHSFQNALWKLRADGRLVIHGSSDEEADRMQVLMAQYHDAPMDLADASLVSAAEALKLRRVFTLDSHFYAYRTADGKALEVVP